MFLKSVHSWVGPGLALMLWGMGGVPEAEAQQGPAELYYTNSLEMVFHRIPAGTYVVGPAGMARRAAIYETGNPAAGEKAVIKKDFYLSVYETRCRDYYAFCKATGHPLPEGEQYDLKTLRWTGKYRPIKGNEEESATSMAMPVTCVSYDDATAFCRWLSEKEGKHYRLPSEVEWEYAARAGSGSQYMTADVFPIGAINGRCYRAGAMLANPDEAVVDVDNIEENVEDKKQGTMEMYKLGPNPRGLYHMLGNVQEFVVMTRDPPEDEIPLPGYTVLPGKVNRMLRGGSWLHDERDCTVFRANYNCPPYSNATIGFRVALDTRD